MLVTTRAIVLHSFRYGETKTVVDLLTAGHGRVACIATLSKSPKAKLKKQYFQPLFIIEAVIDLRQRSRLQRLKEARVAMPFTSIPFSPPKLAIAMFTAEFLRSATRGEQADETLFAYVENSVMWLDGCASHFANFHLVFMMRLARFLDELRHDASVQDVAHGTGPHGRHHIKVLPDTRARFSRTEVAAGAKGAVRLTRPFARPATALP